jgi:hypothetical protein
VSTARDLCVDSLKESGVLGVGQTALSEDISDAFTRLQRMIAVWQKQRWLVPSLQDIQFNGDGSKFYTVGLGGNIDIIPPSDVKGGYVIQRNTGQTPVSLPLKKIFSYENYIQITVKDLTSLPTRFFYDNAYPLAKLYPWPIASNQYELHFIIQSRLGFGSTIKDGSITTGGAAYTDGQYNAVALTGGVGQLATADITVTGGVVAVVTLVTGGQDFAIGNILTAVAADIGGTGAGFTWTVSDITSNLDTEIIMPEEYEEAIMYNLTLRVCSMYQVEAMPDTKRLAKAGLNIIRKNNTQVPTLSMPAAPGLRRRGGGAGFTLYNPDNY